MCLALQELLRREIPLAGQMEVVVDGFDDSGLRLSMPLGPNRNPHQTAFAGSLNALCTLAGWAMTHLLLDDLEAAGSTVIRRSSIKFHAPVQTERVVARCLATPTADMAHFAEMLVEKGQAKLDHVVQVEDAEGDRPAVLFAGSYVVTAAGALDATMAVAAIFHYQSVTYRHDRVRQYGATRRLFRQGHRRHKSFKRMDLRLHEPFWRRTCSPSSQRESRRRHVGGVCGLNE